MNSSQILDSLKSNDLTTITVLSEQAIRQRQEAFIPLLIYCLKSSDDSLLKRNLIRLMALYNQKYLAQIKTYIQDEDKDVINLAKDLVSLIESRTSISDTESLVNADNTAANNLYRALNNESVEELSTLVSEYKNDISEWNEVQRQELTDFLIPRCFGSRSNVSDTYKALLLDLLVHLEPSELEQNYLALLNNDNYEMFRWGVVGLAKYKSELLTSKWEDLINSYQGSVAQRHLLKMYLQASRQTPILHKKWLSEVVQKFENDKVLIKEIAEAYKWKLTDTVALLLTWFNSVKDDDLKFRIVRSLDGLLKIEHIQFLRNTIEITQDERDLRILNNLLIPLESRNNKHNKSKFNNSKLNSESLRNFVSAPIKILLFLTISSVFISFLIVFNYQTVEVINHQKVRSEIPKITNRSLNLDQCDAYILSLEPVRIHCDGHIINVKDSSKDWQRHWVGEAIKVKLTDLNFSTLNSMEYEGTVLKLDKIPLKNDLPTIGQNLN